MMQLNFRGVFGIGLGLSLSLSGLKAQASYPIVSTVFQDTFSEAPHAVAPGSPLNANWTPSPGNGGQWEVSQGQAPAGAAIPNFIPSGTTYGAQYVPSVTLGTTVTNWLLTVDVQDIFIGPYPSTSAGQVALLGNWNGASLGIGGSGAAATGLKLVINPSFTGIPTLGGATKTMFLAEVVGGVESVLWTQALPLGSDGLPEGVWHTLTLARDGNLVQASGLGFTSTWFNTSIPNTGFAGQAYGYVFSFSGQEGLAIDNFTIYEIPEPSSAVLLAWAGFAMLRRR